MGWAAVVLMALVASFFASLAGGELPTDPWGMRLFHLIEMPSLLGLAVAALRWPRAGGVVVAVGGFWPAIPPILTGGQGAWETLALLAGTWPIIAVVVVTGVLIFFGRPRPGRVTYGIVVGVPLVIFTLSLVVGAVFPLGDNPIAQRVSPEAEAVTVAAGQSLTFTASLQDPDGNLRQLEWVVDGQTRQRVDLAGGQAQESYEVAFPDAGRVTVEAYVTDTRNLDGGVIWSVTVEAPAAR